MREHWTLDPGIHFLNHGSYGAAPRYVLDAQARWRSAMESEPVRFMVDELPGAWLDAAARLARFAGATVAQVASGGPAQTAGLQADDVITKLGDATIADQNDLVAAIASHQPGDQLSVTVKRGSETKQLTITLGTQPAQSSAGG